MKPEDLQIMMNQVITKTSAIFSDMNDQFEEGLAQLSSFLISFALLGQHVDDELLPRLLSTATQVCGVMSLHFTRLGRHPRMSACNAYTELCARLLLRSPVILAEFFSNTCTNSVQLIEYLVINSFF